MTRLFEITKNGSVESSGEDGRVQDQSPVMWEISGENVQTNEQPIQVGLKLA